MEVTWLFEVAGNNWSTKDVTWSSTGYTAKIYPSSFSGVTMRWDISGNSLIAPNDVSFEVDGTGHALERSYVTIRLVVDGTEQRTWVFKIKSAVEYYGKTKCTCVDFLRDYLEGSWPNTPHPKEVWPSNDAEEQEDLDNSCIPVVLGDSPYIPAKCVYVSGYERVYVLGKSGPTYTVNEVHSPHSWANQSTWANGDSDISLDLYTDSGYQLLDPVITLEGVTGTGIWTSGDTYYDMLCNYTRGDTSSYTSPVDWIEYILENFGIPSTYIDSTNFSNTASALESSLEFVGGFFQKEAREKVLANLLHQIDCYLVCTDKVRIYQFEAASQETFTRVLTETFSPQKLTKSSSDSGKIQWPESKTKPQDKLAGKATVPSHQGGSTDDPSGTTLRCRFLAGQSVNAQKAGILYYQKRLQQKNKVSFSHILTELSTVGLSPGQVITVDDTLYGGTRDLIVTELTIGRDLQVDITGIELYYLEDWADLSVSSISITQDDSKRWNTISEDNFSGTIKKHASDINHVGSTSPSDPKEGWYWLDTTVDKLKRYNGSSWVVQADVTSSNPQDFAWIVDTSDKPENGADVTQYHAGDINHIGSSAPSNPQKGWMWLDTSQNPDELKKYNGSSWDLVGTVEAKWSGVVDDGSKPEDNADVTSDNGQDLSWIIDGGSLTISTGSMTISTSKAFTVDVDEGMDVTGSIFIEYGGWLKFETDTGNTFGFQFDDGHGSLNAGFHFSVNGTLEPHGPYSGSKTVGAVYNPWDHVYTKNLSKDPTTTSDLYVYGGSGTADLNFVRGSSGGTYSVGTSNSSFDEGHFDSIYISTIELNTSDGVFNYAADSYKHRWEDAGGTRLAELRTGKNSSYSAGDLRLNGSVLENESLSLDLQNNDKWRILSDLAAAFRNHDPSLLPQETRYKLYDEDEFGKTGTYSYSRKPIDYIQVLIECLDELKQQKE